jgi:hypothetical protein
LLLTNADEIDILYDSSTHDYIVRSNFRLCGQIMIMLSWPIKIRNNIIIHAFVKGVFITSVCQEIMSNAHFVKQRERAKQKRKKLKRC